MSRDNAVVAVVAGLTPGQAGRLSSRIMMAKQKIAPESRGTIASVNEKQVGRMIRCSNKRIEKK